jgi:hypothetical protein
VKIEGEKGDKERGRNTIKWGCERNKLSLYFLVV